jgi:inhibitor of KinA sporulation pathway (predicted exonuclease)
VVIDLEATCSRDETVPKKEMEIIEIGAVAVDAELRCLDEFQAFVRPVRHPELTPFCRELTTITQADVDAAETLPAVARAMRNWVDQLGAGLWASWGMFDRMLFDRDFRYHCIPSPLPRTHINVRECFEATVATGPADFAAALAQARLAFEGQPHRGIDDARNIARLLPIIEQCAST